MTGFYKKYVKNGKNNTRNAKKSIKILPEQVRKTYFVDNAQMTLFPDGRYTMNYAQ